MAKGRVAPARSAFTALPPIAGVALEDNSEHRQCAVRLFDPKRRSNDPTGLAARLSQQLLRQNRARLQLADVTGDVEFDGRDVHLCLRSGNRIGTLPLISPMTATQEFLLRVKPRFAWSGVGAALGRTGWAVVPSLPPLPPLRNSEREVPRWVIAGTVLQRLTLLVRRLRRRFDLVRAVRLSPRGRVDWTTYASRHLPNGAWHELPCEYPDLLPDRQLRGAIHYALRLVHASLQAQPTAEPVVRALIEQSTALLHEVADAPPQPLGTLLQRLQRSSQAAEVRAGLEAMSWVEERAGLAGPADLTGLPWVLTMDALFEAWCESLLRSVAQDCGGVLRTGRKQESVAALSWSPGLPAAQHSLRPDLIVQGEGWALIADAKYKRHWHRLHTAARAEDVPGHREDLLQILAYLHLVDVPTVIGCLMYPCSRTEWDELSGRNRLFHRTQVPAHGRSLQVWLTAVPLEGPVQPVVNALTVAVRQLRG